MKRFLFVVIFCVFASALFAQRTYDFNENCKAAYDQIMRLKLDSGQQLITTERLQHPNNLIPDLLEGYIDFFVLFFNENPEDYAVRKENFQKRLDAFDSGPKDEPFYRYAKALTYIQRAAVKIKFGERYSAGWDFKKANSQVKDNISKFPGFEPNNMIFGPIQVVIGTIPQGYKWITSLFGFQGSISSGMRLMRNFINSNDEQARLFSNEAIFYYSYLLFYIENKPEEVFKLIRSKKLDLVNNHLFAYLAANLAINSKQTNYALSVLNNRNTSDAYLKTSVWDFELGYVKLHQLQLDSSIYYFQHFVDNFKGGFYVKDVLQKLCWAHYLKGDSLRAEEYRQLTMRKGNTESDADKKAYRDARNNIWPNKLLLKARILNDGGFNKEALLVLDGKKATDFIDPADALEFSYRMARIYDDLDRDTEAIANYKTAIELGKNRPEYFAARAALQMGNIYEKRGQTKLAINAYEQCLSMGDHEYKDSLDQRAKSGIGRCKGE